MSRRRTLEELRALQQAADDTEKAEQRESAQHFHIAGVSLLRGVAHLAHGQKELGPAMLMRAKRFIALRSASVMREVTDPMVKRSRAVLLLGADANVRCVLRLQPKGRALSAAEREHIDKLCAKQVEYLRKHAGQMLTQGVQKELREVFGPQKSWHTKALLSALEAKLGNASWQIERTIRTECSGAFNLGQQEAMKRLVEQTDFRGKLYKRWTELVSDLTGRPLDKRVEQDSLLLHGQVTPPAGVFVMPSSVTGNRLVQKLQGRVWSHPPNRCNDRAILTPWMAGWGIPAWIYRGGQRFSV